jgi:hypothetical protein
VAERGDRVKAVRFSTVETDVDDNATVPPGTKGTVAFVDDFGTLHTDWDNGARLGLLPGCDVWEDLDG